MSKLKLEIEYDPEDLKKSILFMHRDPKHVDQIKEEYFPATKINIDMTKIVSDDQRTYYYNSLTAALITIQEAAKCNQ